MTVEQLMRRPQSPAAGAVPSGHHAKETARIETIRGRIEPKENRAPRQRRGETAPEKNRAATPHLTHDRRRHARRQWNADFTSGLHNTMRTQMPMGNPTQQHGEIHGTMEMIVAVMTIP